MDAIITNTINNLFHIIWISQLLLEPKYGKKKTVVLSFLATLLYQVLFFAMVFHGFFGDMAYLAGYLMATMVFGGVYIFILSKFHPAKSLFVISAYFCLWTFIYGTISVVTESYAGAGNLAIWLLRILLNVFFLVLYRLFLQKKLLQALVVMKSGYKAVSAISFLAFFMLTILIVYNQKQKNHDFLQIFIMVSVYIFMLGVYIVLFQLIVQSDNKYRLSQMQLHEELLLARIDSYEKMEQNLRQTRHDFRHHNIVVMEFARNRDFDGILSYLQEYEAREEEKSSKSYCSNHAVDNVLSAYLGRAGQNGIETEVKVCFWENIAISDYDLVSILANILDNAIHGCMEAEGKRCIKLSIQKKCSKLILICENTCKDDIRFRDGVPKAKGHDGIGVASILNSVEKYNGSVDFSVEGSIFLCRVILNNKSFG